MGIDFFLLSLPLSEARVIWNILKHHFFSNMHHNVDYDMQIQERNCYATNNKS